MPLFYSIYNKKLQDGKSKDFIEDTRCYYPQMCFDRDNLLATELEIESFKVYLELAEKAGDLDPEIIPYLKRINNTNKIVTVFSCWGHPLPDYQDGNLLFRSAIDYETLLDKVIFPLVEEYHYTHSFNFRAALQVWETTDNDGNYVSYRGYCLSGFPLKEEDKHRFFSKLCELLEAA